MVDSRSMSTCPWWMFDFNQNASAKHLRHTKHSPCKIIVWICSSSMQTNETKTWCFFCVSHVQMSIFNVNLVIQIMQPRHRFDDAWQFPHKLCQFAWILMAAHLHRLYFWRSKIHCFLDKFVPDKCHVLLLFLPATLNRWTVDHLQRTKITRNQNKMNAIAGDVNKERKSIDS